MGLLVLGGQQLAMGAEPAEPGLTSDYLVTFAPGTTQADRVDLLDTAGAVVTSSVEPLRLYAASLTDDQVAALRGSNAVTSVEADRVREVQLAPNDPAYGDQWALDKIGWGSAYDSVAPNGSATVAVLDTGVNATDDLAGHLVPGTSVLGDNDTADPNGHGTAMASIVAAGVDNGVGIAGVGFQGVSVMPVKVLDQDGLGQDSGVVEGVVYAADHGADVILMSFSNPGASSALQAAVDYAWSKGSVLVAATGNDGVTTASYPAGTAKVVGVSATTRDDTLWSGSNSGADTFLGAPGVDIATGSGPVTGTSASAAIVAGVAALVRANDPSAGPGVVVGRLARNADPAGSVSDTGNGRVNLARAMDDTSTEPIVPEGVAGQGGPVVGPYVAGAASEISGTVVTDVNGNGSVDPGDNLRAGVSIVLWQDRNDDGILQSSGADLPSLRVSISSATGRYEFVTNSDFNNNTRYFVQVQLGSGFTTTAVTACAISSGSGTQSSTVSGTTNVVRFGNGSPACLNGRFLVQPTNSAPSATVSLSPVSPATNQIVTATATKSDPDGNAVTLTYVWKVNGTIVKTTSGSSSLTDTLDLSVAGNGNRGDTIRVEVTPNDGTANGGTVNDQLVVGNSAPSATVSLSPVSPTTNQTVTATATKSDADGDAVSLTYVWKVNGSIVK
ncbi:S8 family serine peptidase, partial [Nocardioides islandensis]